MLMAEKWNPVYKTAIAEKASLLYNSLDQCVNYSTEYSIVPPTTYTLSVLHTKGWQAEGVLEYPVMGFDKSQALWAGPINAN